MENKTKNDRRKFIIGFGIVLVIGCILYLGAHATYTSYESTIGGDVKTDIAGIQLTINGQNVVTGDSGALDNALLIDNVSWTSTHTREGKISPGSSGTIELELDPSGSDVALLYEFQFVDKSIDSEKLLTFTSVTSTGGEVVKTAIDTYSGIISLDDIDAGNTITITINFVFDNTVDIEGIEEDLGTYDDLFDINFHALQYAGETLVEYDPNA